MAPCSFAHPCHPQIAARPRVPSREPCRVPSTVPTLLFVHQSITCCRRVTWEGGLFLKCCCFFEQSQNICVPGATAAGCQAWDVAPGSQRVRGHPARWGRALLAPGAGSSGPLRRLHCLSIDMFVRGARPLPAAKQPEKRQKVIKIFHCPREGAATAQPHSDGPRWGGSRGIKQGVGLDIVNKGPMAKPSLVAPLPLGFMGCLGEHRDARLRCRDAPRGHDTWHIQHTQPPAPDPIVQCKPAPVSPVSPTPGGAHRPHRLGHGSGKELRFLLCRRGKPRHRDVGTLPVVSVGGSGSGKRAAESAGGGRAAVPPGHAGVCGSFPASRQSSVEGGPPGCCRDQSKAWCSGDSTHVPEVLRDP